MSRSRINLNDEKIKKSDFYKNKKIFNIDNIDVNKILVSKIFSTFTNDQLY